jgi:hypothetical protein
MKSGIVMIKEHDRKLKSPKKKQLDVLGHPVTKPVQKTLEGKSLKPCDHQRGEGETWIEITKIEPPYVYGTCIKCGKEIKAKM